MGELLWRIRRWWRLTHGDAAGQIRVEMAGFGYDLSGYTDREIGLAINYFYKASRGWEVTASEASSRLSTAVRIAYPEWQPKESNHER